MTWPPKKVDCDPIAERPHVEDMWWEIWRRRFLPVTFSLLCFYGSVSVSQPCTVTFSCFIVWNWLSTTIIIYNHPEVDIIWIYMVIINHHLILDKLFENSTFYLLLDHYLLVGRCPKGSCCCCSPFEGLQDKNTVNTEVLGISQAENSVFVMLIALGSKNRGSYRVLWTAPGKNTSIYMYLCSFQHVAGSSCSTQTAPKTAATCRDTTARPAIFVDQS